MMAEIQHALPNASWETRGYWEGAGRDEIFGFDGGFSRRFLRHRWRGCGPDAKSAQSKEKRAVGYGHALRLHGRYSGGQSKREFG